MAAAFHPPSRSSLPGWRLATPPVTLGVSDESNTWQTAAPGDTSG